MHPSPLQAHKDFNMLSLKDLIEARDLYHVHLMHKDNVVATAIGLYRIRREDPWPTGWHETERQKTAAKKASKVPRTLENSEIRPYSWPCILVFVDQWVQPGEFSHNRSYKPEDMVPPAIYMPDGRVVPLCVIHAPRDESAPGPVENLTFPQNLMGGGYPVLVEAQGEEHVASVGCLVTDGHLIYALTNRHVAGEPGELVYTISGGRMEVIGKSSPKQLTRLLFEDIYAPWPGKNVYVNMDIGLVEIEDKTRWTAQVYGIGTMGKLADLSIDNISLRLIGCHVCAYGAASRQMKGEIHGLFYRFKSVGGFEYVSDFLIGPRKEQAFGTHPGDSGTVWLLEVENESEAKQTTATRGKKEKPTLMPLAVQWGGHVFVENSGRSRLPFALATALSTVCDRLQVDLIRDWNIGLPEYWGTVGHYTIANKACAMIVNRNLKKLMQANLENITFEEDDIEKKTLSGLSKKPFVPLADVPDLVWKIGRSNRGLAEHPNHFADMDKPNPDNRGMTLLEMCKGQSNNVDLAVWQKYYHEVGDKSCGLLPFRVWQFYQSMVEFVKNGDVTEFVCAAGILSHYVGDACQPLHISYLFNGDPDDTEITTHRDRHGNKVRGPVPRAAGVHAAYEDGMVDTHSTLIKQGVDKLRPKLVTPPPVNSGHDAAVCVVGLMQKTFDTISPKDIVDVFLAVKNQKPREISDALWDKFGEDTIAVIADGSRYLAHLWDAAWKAGGGDHTIKELDAIDPKKLKALYQDHSFLPSRTLDTIGPLLSGGHGSGKSGTRSRKASTKTNRRRAARKPRTKRK